MHKTIAGWLLVAVAMVAVGCGDDAGGDDGAGGGGSGGGSGGGQVYFTATIDGVEWSSDADKASWSMNHGGISITGTESATNLAITMNLGPSFDGPGVFELDGSTISLAQLVAGAFSSAPGAWPSMSGQAEITAVNGDIVEGTLQFVGVSETDASMKTVMDGEFRLPRM